VAGLQLAAKIGFQSMFFFIMALSLVAVAGFFLLNQKLNLQA
jgi:hypothetical protein